MTATTCDNSHEVNNKDITNTKANDNCSDGDCDICSDLKPWLRVQLFGTTKFVTGARKIVSVGSIAWPSCCSSCSTNTTKVIDHVHNSSPLYPPHHHLKDLKIPVWIWLQVLQNTLHSDFVYYIYTPKVISII